MAIVNRDKDVSEQKEVIHFHKQLVNLTGSTFIMAHLPFPFEVLKVCAAARALSGTPSVEAEIYTFSGGVTINSAVMAPMLLPAWGTSGSFSSASLGTAGSTQVQGAAQSALVLTLTGANSAADDCVVTVVVKKLQDIVSHFGTSS